MVYWAYRTYAALLRFLPLRGASAAARLLYKLGYWCSPARRANVCANLRMVLGRQDVARQAREVFGSFGRYQVEFLSSRKVKGTLGRRALRQGEPIFSEALRRGRGVLALTPHLGNWEMAAHLLAAYGAPVHAVFFTHPDARLNAVFMAQRRTEGLNVIPWKQDAARLCLEALRRGQIVAIAGDIDFPGTGIEVRWFGKKMRIPAGPVVLARRTGAMIVTGGYVWVKSRGLLLFEEAIDPSGLAGEVLAQKIADSLERLIRRYPTQWICFEKLF